MTKIDFTQGIIAMEADLHRFAYRLTSDYDTANDLVQDSMLHALGNQDKFAHTKNLKGWMFTLMRNLFITNYRRVVLESEIIENSYSLTGRAMFQSGETDRFEFAYDLNLLYKVVNSIPDEMKRPFQMFVSGFKYREIADKLNLPIGTVKSRLYFVRKRLKAQLMEFA